MKHKHGILKKLTEADKILKAIKHILKEAYIEASQDPNRSSAIKEWENLDGDHWNN